MLERKILKVIFLLENSLEKHFFSGLEKNQSVFLENYQNVLVKIEETVKQLKLTFGTDIPFWFDEVSYRNDYGNGLLSEWVIDHIDVISIMSYRNKANGKNGINSLVKSEINYAKKVGGIVNVGVEMHPSDEGDNVSFNDKNLTEVRMQLQLVKKKYEK